MVKHRTRRGRKGGLLGGHQSKVSNIQGLFPKEDMVAKQARQAGELANTIISKIQGIPLKVVSGTERTFLGRPSEANEELNTVTAKFAKEISKTIEINPEYAITELNTFMDKSDEQLWSMVKNYKSRVGGRKSRRMRRKTKRFSRRR